MLALRAVSSVYVNNANSGTVPLPVGSVADDTIVLFASHGYMPNTPAGWEVIESNNPAWYCGGVFTKVLTADDITAGTITVTFAGTFWGHVAAVCIIGPVLNVRFKGMESASTGAASRTLNSNPLPVTGDLAIYYGAGRTNTAIASSQGDALDSNSSVNSSFVLTGGNLTEDGAITETWTFPVAGPGDFCAMLVLTDEEIPTYGDVALIAVEALSNNPPNAQVAAIGVEALQSNVAEAQIALVGVEVLRAVTSVLRRRPVFLAISAVDDAGIVYPAGTEFVDGEPLFIDTDTVEF